MSGDNSAPASARTAGALSDPKALPTRNALSLPWRLKDHERGFEIHSTPVGWIFVLDDSIGNIDRAREGDDFLREQRIHADYMIHAANCHHDLVEACAAAKALLINKLYEPDRTVFWKLADAIGKAADTPASAEARSAEANPETLGDPT